MKTYNNIMLYFWLATTFVIIIAVTIMGFKDGFEKWSFYYVFALLTFLVYLLRKYMMRRMEKHQDFLEGQHKRNKD